MTVPALIMLATALAAIAGTLIAVVVARRRRRYGRLASALARAASIAPASMVDQRGPAPAFDARLVTVPGFLPPPLFDALRREGEALAGIERSYVPAHKKGGTVAYETIIARAPAILGLYHSEAFQLMVSRIVGVRVLPTPLYDQSSLSVLVYDRPGDHIGWHYDHNFYRGRHFTLLVPLLNTGHDENGLSHARLSASIAGRRREIAAAPNTLVLFEGAKVRHKVSPIAAGERRVVLSMTYCTDPRANLAQAVARRIKDTAFFGLRALWT